VHKLAELAGITVRTLHHYDQIGLLRPSFSGSNGYRYYEQEELIKLQQILFFRELEFSLEQIKDIMDSPNFDFVTAMQDQRKMLQLKKDRIDMLLATIEKTIRSRKGSTKMKNDDLYGGFTKKQMEEYKEEARKRWGDTDAFKQSEERTKHWIKADYDRVAKEGALWTHKFEELRDKGFFMDSPEIQEMIGQHYNALRTFYEPNYEMYRGLGQMYVDDPRFTAYYEKFGKGLALFMRDAMNYFCDTHEKH
ncbi:MAG TPA: MerR family transcriptional regulator, partial [Patescibacteria group bacterium]|nr:MerR family transcriptional regulator [Patescibacteria group bacterium]